MKNHPPLVAKARIVCGALFCVVAAVQQLSAVTTHPLTETQALRQFIRSNHVSPDGQWVIFSAVVDSSRPPRFFSAPTAGGDPIQLTPRPPQGAAITGDSSRVVYRGDDQSLGDFELYSRPIGGGEAIKLTAVTDEGRVIHSDWRLSQDGNKAIYRVNNPLELFAVDVLGGAPMRLNGDLVDGGEVVEERESEDGTTIFYRADQRLDETFELFRVSLDGGVAEQLNTPLVAGRSVVAFGLSPDGAKAFYIADQNTDDVFELYAVELADGTVTQLNGPLVAGGNIDEAIFSPDSQRVIFRADADSNEVFELYSVSAAGGTPLKVSGSLVSGGDVKRNGSGPISWQVDSESQRIVYRADQEADHLVELFSVAHDGGEVTKLSPELEEDGFVDDGFLLAEGRALFRADVESNLVHELFSVPVTGGVATRLNAPLNFRVHRLAEVRANFTVKDGDVFYVAPQDSVVPWLYRVPIVGGPPTLLNQPAEVLTHFTISDDGNDLYYLAEVVPGREHFYRTSLVGPSQHQQLSPESAFKLSFVNQIEVSEATGRVVYSAAHEVYKAELFSQPIDGGLPMRLSSPLVAGGRLETFRLSPDGGRVVYTAEQEIAGTLELYSTSVEGGDVVKLNIPPTEGGGRVFDLHESPFTPDGETFVYTAFQGPVLCGLLVSLGNELFSVPSEGGAATRLHEPLGLCRDIETFEVGPLGNRVVFRVFDFLTSTSKLFSVPVSGGAVVPLTPDETFSGRVADFGISADGARVVFRGQRVGSSDLNLLSVPIGGGEVVRLNDPLPADGEISQWHFSPDGTQVVYIGEQLAEDVRGLFTVPVVGGTVVDLSGEMVSGGDVNGFTISPSFGRVVFRADREVDGEVNLYVVSLAGGAVEQLSGELAPGERVAEAVVSADSEHVVYRVQLAGSETSKLWSVPLEGGARRLVSHPPEEGDFLATFEINEEGTHVVYFVQNVFGSVGDYYRTSVAGGPVMRFHGPEVRAFGQVGNSPGPWFSPDGSRLVFSGQREGELPVELWLSEVLDLFLDGFESGTTERWSNTVPSAP